MNHPTTDHERADKLLALIADAEAQLEGVQGEVNAALEQVKARYQERVSLAGDVLKGLEKELRAHMKKRRGVLFDGSDRVDLEHGALLHKIEPRVKRARGVLDKLEAFGFDDAIKIAKSVDWDVLEEWPAEKLVAVGTERVQKETFEYETKGPERTGVDR